jgi:hypothetical protein
LVKHGGGTVYIRARLARDAREGSTDAAILLQGVRDGRISAYAAAAEMNYLQRREPNGRGSENMARARDWALHRLFHPRPQKIALDVASTAEGREENAGSQVEPNVLATTLK